MWNEIGSNNDELTSSGLSHTLGRAEEYSSTLPIIWDSKLTGQVFSDVESGKVISAPIELRSIADERK